MYICVHSIGESFIKHNTYQVRPDNFILLFYAPENLADYHPLSLSKSFSPLMRNKDFVSLKYHVH